MESLQVVSKVHGYSTSLRLKQAGRTQGIGEQNTPRNEKVASSELAETQPQGRFEDESVFLKSKSSGLFLLNESADVGVSSVTYILDQYQISKMHSGNITSKRSSLVASYSRKPYNAFDHNPW